MSKATYSMQIEPTDDNIKNVMEKYNICRNGFIYTRNDKLINSVHSVSNNTIRFIYDNFDFLFIERTKFNVGSYGAKHYVEHFRHFMELKDGYVANGELIIALILRGIPFKHDHDSPNCVFKCSYRDEIHYLIHKEGTLKNRYFTNNQ